MFEIKAIGRLYTAKEGLTLVVGKMVHELDWQRTAALTYYHAAENTSLIYKSSTMQKLRAKLENFNSTSPEGIDLLVAEIMEVWELTANGMTKIYHIHADEKKWAEGELKIVTTTA